MCALLVGLGTPALAATLPGVFEPEMDPSLFDIDRYTGLWYEVASKKEGFAGAGQEDCHCTQVTPLQWSTLPALPTLQSRD